jgi:hypothetical protein
MTWFHRFVFTGLFAVSALWAQTHSNAKLPSTSLSGQIAPSDSAIQSSSTQQSALVAIKKNTQKSNVNNVKSILATGSVQGGSRGLCFQPGIGWQHIPQGSVNSSQITSFEEGSARATEMSASSPGVGQPGQDQCPGIMTNELVRGAIVENTITDKQPLATDSNIRTTDANFGMQNLLNANTLLNPASSAASTQLKMGLNSGLPDSGHFSQGTGLSPFENSIQAFEGRAYVSPIKLREMMRSAPDLETRLKLRRLSRKLSEEQKRRSDKSAATNRRSRTTSETTPN